MKPNALPRLLTRLLLASSVAACGGSGNGHHDSGADGAQQMDSSMMNGTGLVLNEIQGDGADFVEIVNTNAVATSLGGYYLCDGHCAGTPAILDDALVFPADLTLAPGEHFIVVFNVDVPSVGVVTDFDACLGAARCMEYKEGLSGTNGDSALLFTPDSVAIDMLSWPLGGIGNTAQTLCRLPDGTGPLMHCASTPGAVNTEPADAGVADAGMDAEMDAGMDASAGPVLVINEVEAAGAPDWFEIVNLGPGTFTFSGHKMCDDHCAANTTAAIAFPNITLAEGEHFLVRATNAGTMNSLEIMDTTTCLGATRCTELNQNLGTNGDTVVIFDSADVVVATYSWAAAAAASSTWCRSPDGTGTPLVNTCAPTPGTTNP